MDKGIEIRKIEPEERENALNLVLDVFMKFEAPEYPEEGVHNFQSFVRDKETTTKLDMYGAFMDSDIIGVLAMREQGTHISLFFVDEKYHRQGIGRALFEYMLKRTNPKQITVHAAPYAVEVYRRLGFVETDAERIEDGIRYTPMRLQQALHMDIHLAKKSDLEKVKDITYQTISEVYPHFYPGGVVDFFLELHNAENIMKDIVLSNTYLAVCDEECVGTITINEREISRLFVLPAYQGKGLGTALMDFAEEKILESYSEIELHASLSGKKMYIKRGYKEKEYRCKELENGDWICIDIMVLKKP